MQPALLTYNRVWRCVGVSLCTVAGVVCERVANAKQICSSSSSKLFQLSKQCQLPVIRVVTYLRVGSISAGANLQMLVARKHLKVGVTHARERSRSYMVARHPAWKTHTWRSYVVLHLFVVILCPAVVGLFLFVGVLRLIVIVLALLVVVLHLFVVIFHLFVLVLPGHPSGPAPAPALARLWRWVTDMPPVHQNKSGQLCRGTFPKLLAPVNRDPRPGEKKVRGSDQGRVLSTGWWLSRAWVIMYLTIRENTDKDEIVSGASIDQGAELTHTFHSACGRVSLQRNFKNLSMPHLK